MNFDRILVGLMMALLMAASCTKRDLQPEAVGEPVPYTPDATRNWEDVMNDSEFSLFRTAFERSGVSERIKNTNGAFQTIFMPADAAFESDGWTLEKINETAPEKLDSLLSYFIVSGRFTRDALQMPQPRNYPLNTLLSTDDLPKKNSWDPAYVYKLHIGSWKDSLTINGRSIGLWSRSEDVRNGYVYKIDQWVPRPTITILEYLQTQPRFSLLLEAIEASVHYYELALSEGRYGHDPEYMLSLSACSNSRVTLFLPTNEAFANSGYHSIEDINRRIEQSLPIQPADYDKDMYYLYPKTAMDSMLIAHGFALLRASFDATFYFKDLSKYPSQLSGFMVQNADPFQEGPHVRVENNFKLQDDRVWLTNWRRPAEYQPIAEADIDCLNGVIHVVNEFVMKP